MSDEQPAPRPRQNRILLGKFYEKTSQSGQRYFQGVLGFGKLLVFHDDKAASDNEWNMYLVERSPDEMKPKTHYSGPMQNQPNAVGQQGSYGAQIAPRSQPPANYQGQQGYPPRQQQPRQLPPEGGQLDDSIPF